MTKNNHTDNLTADDLMAFTSGIAAFEAKYFVRAYQLLLPLAEVGHPAAQYRLAIMCQNGLGRVKNEGAAFQWMKAAAEQGLGLAQHGLGFMYLQGEGVAPDNSQALFWFRQAAEQGLEGSQAMLASLSESRN